MSNVVKHPSNLNVKITVGSVHEKGENLHKVIDPLVLSTSILQAVAQHLCNDSTKFPRSSTNSMRRRSIPGREYLTRNNECSGVRAKVLEKVAKTVESEEPMSGDRVISKSDNREEDGEHNKTE